MRAALLLALSLAPLPALAQAVPETCTVTRQCTGAECTDNPGVTLRLEATATGLVSWDVAVPTTRIELTELPGSGPRSWAGRAPELQATVLMTLLREGVMQVAMHAPENPQHVFVAYLDCPLASPSPAPTKRR
jgi:hypothetical protein